MWLIELVGMIGLIWKIHLLSSSGSAATARGVCPQKNFRFWIVAVDPAIKLIDIYRSYFLVSSLPLTRQKSAINFSRCQRKPTNNFALTDAPSSLKKVKIKVLLMSLFHNIHITWFNELLKEKVCDGFFRGSGEKKKIPLERSKQPWAKSN